MGFLGRLLRRERPGSPRPLPGWADWMIGQAHALPEEAFIYPDAYRLLPDVYAAVSLIQERMASLPLKFYRGTSTEEVTDEPIVKIWRTANARDTGHMLVQQIIGSLDINGNGYLFKDYFGGKTLQELWCLAPHRVKKIPGKHGTIEGYIYDPGDGKQLPIPTKQIVPFQRYDPDHGVLGMSPLQAVMTRMLTQRDAQRWLRNTYKQGGTIAGFFSTEQGLGDPDIKRLQEEMKKRFGGPEAAGRPVILPRGLKFERQALTMAELQFLESSNMVSADIFRIYHIPPVIMGVKQGGGLSDAGATTDLLLFYENCIIPRCELIQSVLNEVLLGDDEFGTNLRCEFDLSGVLPLQDVFLKQAKLFTEIAGGPVMTRAEVREKLGLKDLQDPELDKLLLPSTMVGDKAFGGPGTTGTQGTSTTEGTPRITGPPFIRNDVHGRDAWRRKTSQRLSLHEARVAREVRRLFRRWQRRAITALQASRAARAINVEDLLNLTAADEKLVRAFITAVVEDAGNAAIADLALELSFNLQSEAAAQFIRERTHVVLNSLMQTTWVQLRASLAQGTAAGETTGALVERIKAVMAGRIASSTETIARTETVSAYNAGNYEAWNQAGPDMVPGRVWVTARDNRVRDQHGTGHDEAEGKSEPMGTPFSVRANGDAPFELLMFPGDPSASPANTINCRCVAMPLPPAAPEREFGGRLNTRGARELLTLLNGKATNGHRHPSSR